jgi:RNA polymerase sigma-70 factor (ECF subfamily)
MSVAFTRTGSAAALLGHGAAPESSSDQMLLIRIASGDQLAMRTLFARYQVPLYRWIVRIVGNEALAEELLSNVFLDVWRQAASFQARSSVSTWLLSIARFKALSARRRRIAAQFDDKSIGEVPDPIDDPEIVLQKKDQGEVLRKSLAKLSPEHIEVIDLVYYHGKSFKEVAEIVGIGEATAKTRMFYARRKLAELVNVT